MTRFRHWLKQRGRRSGMTGFHPNWAGPDGHCEREMWGHFSPFRLPAMSGSLGSTAVHPLSCGNRQQWVESCPRPAAVKRTFENKSRDTDHVLLTVIVAVSRGADFRPGGFQAGVLRRPDRNKFQDTISQPVAWPGKQTWRSRLFAALNSVEMIFSVPWSLMAVFPEPRR
jgi:hypothetical protein